MSLPAQLLCPLRWQSVGRPQQGDAGLVQRPVVDGADRRVGDKSQPWHRSSGCRSQFAQARAGLVELCGGQDAPSQPSPKRTARSRATEDVHRPTIRIGIGIGIGAWWQNPDGNGNGAVTGADFDRAAGQ